MNKDELLERMRKYMWTDALIMIVAIIVLLVFAFVVKNLNIAHQIKNIISLIFIPSVVGAMRGIRIMVRKRFMSNCRKDGYFKNIDHA